MSKDAFGKFINPKPTGAKKKEKHKQEKRAVKKERADYFDNKKREERKAKKEAFVQREFFDTQINKKPTKAAPASKSKFVKEVTPTNEAGKPMRKRLYSEEAKFTANSGKKSFFKTKESIEAEKKAKYEAIKTAVTEKKEKLDAAKTRAAKPINMEARVEVRIKKPLVIKPSLNAPIAVKKERTEVQMPLNKYVSHCGVCSRREAVTIIQAGKIKVNNKTVLEPGYKILHDDVVKLDGQTILPQHNLVYILLNKPKDFLTTADDPQGRRTVMDLIANATPERVYPVGRLDRNTTGVLLFTNDGDLAQKLTHPSNEIKKIYEVKLDKPLTKADAEKILAGVKLEDGFIAPDALAFVDNNDKSVIGIEIHSGKNRIVRRIFEFMGYDVKNLDRVMFANLTKKNVERGRYRFLLEKEVRNLKFLNASKGNHPGPSRGDA
jgi:23S rRNA pseudouridine2605 synthase